MLRNLVGTYQHSDEVALYRVARLWASVTPGNVEPCLLTAQVAERLGATSLAVAALREALECLPPAPVAQRIQTALARLERQGGAN